MKEQIDSVYVEAILSTKKLKEQIQAIETSKFEVCFKPDYREIEKFRQNLESKFNNCIPIKFCADTGKVDRILKNYKNTSLEFPIEIDDRNIVSAINKLKKTVEATTFKPKVEFDSSPLVTQINQAIEKVNQGGKLGINLKIREGANSRGEFREITAAIKNLEKTTRANKPTGGILQGFTEAIGQNIFKNINLGIKDVFGKEVGSVFRKATASGGKVLKKEVLENEELQLAYKDFENVLSARLRKGAYRLGEGIADSLDATEQSLVERINIITKKTFDGVDFTSLGNEFKTELQSGLSEILNAFTKGDTNLVARFLDKQLGSFREVAIQEKALPLVKERALEILNQKRTKNSAKLVNENTQELFITTGGYAGARGLSGERLAKDINKQGVEGRQAIWVRNNDSDLPKEAMGDASKKLVALLTSLGKPNIRGYSKDALEIASQALAARELNPNITIKILGESGGGFAAEEASKILDMLGIKNEFLGVGTPNFIGGLDKKNRKIISPDEMLGFETHKTYSPLGLAKLNSSQNILGVTGHPFENYQKANIAELQNFFAGSPGEFTPEIKQQFNQGIEAFKNVNKKELSTRELERYAQGAYQNLQYVRRFLLEATEENEKELQQIASEFENIFIDLTPDTREFSELLNIANKAKEYLNYLQAQPGLEASIVAENISKEIDKLKVDVKSKSSGVAGTQKAKFTKLLEEIEETQKALNSISLSPLKPQKIEQKIQEFKTNTETTKIENQVASKIEALEITQNDFEKIFAEEYEKLLTIVENYSKNYQEFKTAIKSQDLPTAEIKGREILKDAIGVKGSIKQVQSDLKLTGFTTQTEAGQLNKLLSQVQRTINEVQRKGNVNKLNLEGIQPLQVPLPDFKNLGKSINQGLAEGYLEANEDTKQKISEANQEIIEQTKQDFEIKSPSRVFEAIGKNISEGLSKGLQNIENLTLNSLVSNLTESFKSLVIEGLKFSSIFVGISKALPMIQEFVSQSLEVSRQMEGINRQVVFASGGGREGNTTLNQLRKTAKDLRLDIQETLQASSGFLASTEGTALEGNIGLNTFQNFQKLFRVRGGNKETQQRALLQLEQMAAIGSIQNVDLKQLSMAVPGVRGILARSQGLSPGELQRATRRGLGSDALIQFSQQAAIESESGLSDALDTLDAKIKGLDNSILELQEKVGNTFLPGQKTSIDLLSKAIDFLTANIDGLLKGLTVLAVKFAYPYVEPLVKQFWHLIKSIDLSKIKLNGLSTVFTKVFSTLKPILTEALIAEAIFAQIDRLRITFSDLGGDISKASKSAKKDIEELLNSLNNQGGRNNKLTNNPLSQFINDLVSDPLTVFNPFDSTRERKTKELVDTQKAIQDILSSSRELSKIILAPKFETNIAQINEIDKQIADVQAKRRGKVETSPGDTKGIQLLQEKEQELIQKRFEILKPVALLQGNLQKRIDDLKNSQKSLDALKDAGTISLDNYEKGSKAVGEELAKLENKQTEINKAVGEAKNAFSLVRRELTGLNIELEDTKTKIELTSNSGKVNLSNAFLADNISKGTKEYLNQVLEIKNAEKSLQSLGSNINQRTVAFQSQDSQRILEAYGVSANTGVARINQLLQNVENENDKFILEEFAKLQQAKLEFSSQNLQVSQLREQLQVQLQEQTKQVEEFYRGLSREVQNGKLEFQKQLNQIKASNTATRIRAALGDSEDSFLNTFVESIIADIEAVNSIANSQLDKKSRQLESQFKLDDTLRGAKELKLSLPSGELPSIPVELNFEGINSDANVEALNFELSNSVNNLDNLNSLTKDFDNLLNGNVETTKSLVNEGEKVVANLETSQQKADGFTASISQSKTETENLNTSLQGVSNQGNIIANTFSSIYSWVGNLVNVTQQWFSEFIKGNEFIQGVLNKINEIKNSLGSLPEQASESFNSFGQGFKDFGKGIINQFGFSTEGQKLGIASPSTTQNLRQILEGQVSAAQSFNAPRPRRRGIHNGIDFDRTEGLGGHSLFNAIFPGKVVNLRQWGAGAAIDREGGEESNALRIESYLPRNLGKFFVDYGHYEVPSAKVREGQFINAGTTLGRLAGNDTASNGGHLDLKIRIPSSIAQGFRNTRNAGNGLHFVDVKEFMSWYQRQIGQFNSGESDTPKLTVPAREVNTKQVIREVNSQRKTPQASRNLSFQGGGRYANKLNHLPPEFLKQVSIEAHKLGTKPEYLLAVMGFETGGTYSPSKTNSLGFTGLIQFSPKYSPGNIGKTTDQLRKMSQMEQLKYVVPYINKNRRGKDVSSLEQLYMSVLMPSAMGKGSNHSLPNWAYSANRGLDINKDGKISVAEATSKVRDYLPNQATRQQLYSQSPISLPILAPRQMQGRINQGEKLARQVQTRSNILSTAQSEADIQRQKQEIARREEQRVNELRRNLESNADIRLSTSRRTEDLRNNINPIKSTSEEFANKIQSLNREYDDIILELTRKTETINRSLDKSRNLLKSGEVTGDNRNLLERKIKDDERTLGVISVELNKVQKMRTEASSVASRVFNREEFIRQQNLSFEESSKQIGVLKAQLEGLQTLQQTNPLALGVTRIPDLQREISIFETNLELNQEIARIEERKFRKELTENQANTQIQRLREINQEKQTSIELTFQQTEAEASLRRQALELDKRSRFSQSDFEILQERVRGIEILERQNPLVTDPVQKFSLQENIQVGQLGLESERKIQEVLEFANSIKLSEDETKKLIDAVEELNNLKLQNIQAEFGQLREEAKISRLEAINNRENRITEFNSTRAFQREQLEIDSFRNQGGNEFVANSRSRLLGRNQEIIRFEREKRELDIEVARMRQSGINIEDSWLSKVREDMEAIHNLNLENINFQFKTFGATLNDIGKQGIQGLAQGLTGVIMQTQSLNDVIDNFFNNILSQVLNTGLQSLLGGLLGGFNLFYEGGIVGSSINSENFKKGMAKEKAMSGKKPRMVIAHDGELIIPSKRVQDLSFRGISPNMLLGKTSNFYAGGIVGNANLSSQVSGSSAKASEIKVEMVRINDVNYVTEDQLKSAMQQAVQQGGELGENRVRSKFRNSISFKKSAGF